MTFNNIPSASYGILQQYQSQSSHDEAAEKVKNLGYAIVDSGYTDAELQNISAEFDIARARYIGQYGESRLRGINELHTMRALFTHAGELFLQLALNKNLHSVLAALIQGKYILNQQNGIINPPQETYNQGAWHRDLPYQHFVSSKPLAINALFCLDDFTLANGATFVIPASHKSESFPSANYIRENSIQIEAKAGSFILLDCMLFHSGGFNSTGLSRRAINHVYNIPYFKQQINIPKNTHAFHLTDYEKDLLGFNSLEKNSIEDYFSARQGY